MAVSTTTASSFLRPARLSHEGITNQTIRYNGGTNTIGDVILLAKVPWGTTIVDFKEAHSTSETSRLVDFGYDDSYSAFLGGATQAQINRLTKSGGIATQFTGSDDAQPRYSILKAKVSGGSTASSLHIAGNISYTFGD